MMQLTVANNIIGEMVPYQNGQFSYITVKEILLLLTLKARKNDSF